MSLPTPVGRAQNNFTVSVGGTVSIQVYLVQTGTTTTLNSPGLQQGGVALDYAVGAPFAVQNSNAITGNANFAYSNTNVGTTTNNGATVNTASVQNVSLTTPVTVPSGTNQILLGTFTFTGLSVGSDVTFTAQPTATGANNVDGNGHNLDGLISGASAFISVTAVPEPGSLMLTGLGAGALGLGVWKRRQKPLAAQVA